MFEKSKHAQETLVFSHIQDYNQTMREMMGYFKEQYNKNKLNEYRPLDLREIEKRTN